MRTPVILVAGQGDTGAVTDVLLQTPGTLVVGTASMARWCAGP